MLKFQTNYTTTIQNFEDFILVVFVLIDDLYQSGVTVNFVGMKLQQAGFNRICGLYLVKSMNDRDNVSSRTGS